MTDKGLDNLRFGIIEQAAIDYVDLLAGFKSPTTEGSSGHSGFILSVTLILNRLSTDWKGKQRL